MDSDTVKAVIGIFTAIVGVAIVAVLVSGNAQTASVLSAATTGFAQDLSVAVSPVTGSGFTSNTLNTLTNSLSSGSLNLGQLDPGGFGG